MFKETISQTIYKLEFWEPFTHRWEIPNPKTGRDLYLVCANPKGPGLRPEEDKIRIPATDSEKIIIVRRFSTRGKEGYTESLWSLQDPEGNAIHTTNTLNVYAHIGFPPSPTRDKTQAGKNNRAYMQGWLAGNREGTHTGYKEGCKRASEEAREEGYEQGYDAGYEDGHTDGYDEAADDHENSPLDSPGYDRAWEDAMRQAEESFLNTALYRVGEILEENLGAQAENHRRLFDRNYACPWCAHELDIEYRQDEQYLAKCPCRIVYIQARSPREAAEKCVFMLQPLAEHHEDDGDVLGHHSPQIEDALIKVGNPTLDDNINQADFQYWTRLPHITNMPETQIQGGQPSGFSG